MKFREECQAQLGRSAVSGEELAWLAGQTPLWGCGQTTMGPLRSRTTWHSATPVNKATENIDNIKSKFMKWAQAEPTNILNLKDASAIMGIPMRRICKVVEVLDGLGLMKKTGVTEVQKCKEFDPTQHIECHK